MAGLCYHVCMSDDNKPKQVQDSHPGTPLFPISMYIYDHNGKHGEPIIINSEEQLHGVGVRMVLQLEGKTGKEIIMTDAGELTVFHMKDGKIIFPPQQS
jgi:hypothetical protein